MAELEYEAPGTVKEAVALLAKAKGKARVLAGGTDLLVQMRSGRVSPSMLVDIKHIDQTRKIAADKSGGFRVGAAVAGAELSDHKGMCKMWPGIVEACDLIGSTQIQGRCSMGGNLCNASPAADTVPMLIAAGVKCTVAGPKGTKTVPVEKIPTGPGKTSLKPGEFVVDFIVPKKPARTGDAYLRMIPRTEMDIAVVGVGACVTLDAKGVVTAARVSLGAVAPTALLVDACAKAIIGTKLDDAAMAKLDAAAQAACKPIDDKRGTITYRKKIAGVLARRAVAIAADRAKGKK